VRGSASRMNELASAYRDLVQRGSCVDNAMAWPIRLRPTIDLLRPAAVVTLDAHSWESVRRLYGLPKVALSGAVEAAAGFVLSEKTRAFPMYHCGNRVVNTVRDFGRQRMDWRRLRDWLSRNPL
jgi:uracil-DNA glycosylase